MHPQKPLIYRQFSSVVLKKIYETPIFSINWLECLNPYHYLHINAITEHFVQLNLLG